MSVQLDRTGENMDESLRIQRFEQIPSSLEFESLIQSTNVPAVKFTHTLSLSIFCLFLGKIKCYSKLSTFFSLIIHLQVFTGCIKDWKAFCKWNPSNGGLDYLQVFFSNSVKEIPVLLRCSIYLLIFRSNRSKLRTGIALRNFMPNYVVTITISIFE